MLAGYHATHAFSVRVIATIKCISRKLIVRFLSKAMKRQCRVSRGALTHGIVELNNCRERERESERAVIYILRVPMLTTFGKMREQRFI